VNRKIVLLAYASILLLSYVGISVRFIACVSAVSPLNLNITTDKPTYFQGERVHVSGTLSLGVNPLVRWLVAISIDTPNGTPLFRRTLETDKAGNFTATFNFPFESKLGTYTVVCSVQWANQYAIREVTLEIKSTESRSSPVLLTLIATVAAFSLIISALIFYGLVTFQKKASNRERS